ncbi:E3 ubiquitin-protein ligase SH3RF1 isoform X2 [Cylas formicarius]|uniref:E3 ubiquitin-protein ligase SH3RF1 isoform X2 n=1 Tax=Cylas formicarius TaxID=197179 RepID=UPI002958D016|nr:E3 ubiquitin-protein ligase SH3RF1 isoform X2 [Cylas formicarius]
MDEGTLNDLLECSVCLERLDTSSKVLPCQHTFCRKCLEEIVQKHKELRCPECRILVNLKVDELPPNVLLMRILEGMKNSGPKKILRSHRGLGNQQLSNVHQLHKYQQSALEQKSNNKHSTQQTIPHQPYAKAVYDYVSKEVGDLSFKKGDIIILKKRIDSHWCQGECGGKQGVFPLSYVQVITPVPSHIPQCKALYDFKMANDDEDGCLSFSKGNVINVIRRVDENWAEGKLKGRIGIFPLAFVEMNNLARSLMKLSTNVQPGPSKVAPPTPTSEESTPLIPTDHSVTCVTHTDTKNVHQTADPAFDSIPNNCSSGSSATTPNVSSSNTSSTSSTAPSSPASPPPRARQLSPRAKKQDAKLSGKTALHFNMDGRPHHHNKEKRHSLTNPTMVQQNSNRCERAKRNSGGSLVSSLTEVQLPTAFMALYPYKPQKPDELELRKGSFYMVSEICQDGWYKGTSNRTQKCGVFPGNYVTLARGIPPCSSKDNPSSETKQPVSFTRSGKGGVAMSRPAVVPPELPPRSVSPTAASNAVGTVPPIVHGQQDALATAVVRSASATVCANSNAQTLTLAKSDKSRDRKDKGTVSLMRRLTSMKRSKSPPPSSYSMDNPVFEDTSVTSSSVSSVQPVHVRSGSCPSQLLQIQSPDHHRLFGPASQRIKHKERPNILNYSSRSAENPTGSSGSSPDMHRHKKSNSLDGNKSTKTGVQSVRERFRCITPYPPNSEYELELQVNDIIYVHKKRDDGWYKGTQQRTGKTGLFPASFVESF